MAGVDLNIPKLQAWVTLQEWDLRRFAAETGCEYSYVFRIMRGQARPGAKFLLGLYRLGLDPKDFLLPGTLLTDNSTSSRRRGRPPTSRVSDNKNTRARRRR